MCRRYLGFLLLVWIPGELHAQPCSAPRLTGGYFVPEQVWYPPEMQLTYACDSGRKPAVEGWWATSTCQNGKWSQEPQCIDENACIPPSIPNGQYDAKQQGWYQERDIIRITCDTGYKHRDWDATADCMNGTWSSVPVCERDIHACGEPPEVPHAVIVYQGYRELFAADSKVQYECEEGYTAVGASNKTSVFCIAGNWTEGPTCTPGEGGSTAGGAGGGHSSSAGSGTPPAGGGSSSSSGSDDSVPLITAISNCGKPPTVLNGDVVERHHMFLKYQCSSFYKPEGSDTVVCYSDGTWSQVPTCRAAFCIVDSEIYPELEPVGVKYIHDGQSVRLECVRRPEWWVDHYSVVRCTNTRPTHSRCCTWVQLKMERC